MSECNIIVASSINNVIGINNSLPWHIPEDLKFFKKMTLGHIMVMGRKTFESLPGVLPNRLHYVLSRNEFSHQNENVRHLTDLTQVKDLQEQFPDKKIYIIGGQQIFEQAIDQHIPSKIYVTRILNSFNGDTFFPDITKCKEWKLESIDKSPLDKTHSIPFQFETYTLH